MRTVHDRSSAILPSNHYISNSCKPVSPTLRGDNLCCYSLDTTCSIFTVYLTIKLLIAGLSVGIDDDNEFVNILRNCWGL